MKGLNHILRRWCVLAGKTKNRDCSKRCSTKLLAERLESRELMSVNAWVDRGTLVVQADPAGGTVDVRSVNDKLQVSGPGGVFGFPASGISGMRFLGSSRVDRFTNRTSINSTIYGFAGDDQLNGGGGVDTIQGGDGHDTISGGSGVTTRTVCSPGFVVGQGLRLNCWTVSTPTGNSLYGGKGDDTLKGGSGVDWLYGESGNDNLYGGEGKDRLDGGSDNDGLYGGREEDVLTGGTGSDRFLRHHWETGWWIFTSHYYGASITDMERQDADVLFEDSEAREFNTFRENRSTVPDAGHKSTSKPSIKR
jgi:Ca2+-binding RTX toxin-like protein